MRVLTLAVLAATGLVAGRALLRATRPPESGTPDANGLPYLLGAEGEVRLRTVAEFDAQVTGVTVSEDNRIFVNFPRWSEDVAVSVAEVMKDGTIRPYPDEEWNRWRNARMGDLPAEDHFVCVQSVVADGRGSLFVVDPAAPNAEKTIPGGPKVVRIDLASDSVSRVYPIAPEVAGAASYLNDIRISPDGRFAYMTDSGQPGGLVVLRLEDGAAWRVLDGAPETQADPAVTVTTDGRPLRRPDGRQPIFNADGIALSPDGEHLYWQALTGRTLYRVKTAVLHEMEKGHSDGKAPRVEKVAETEPVDGLWIDADGRIYLSAIGEDAVKLIDADGRQRTLVADRRLRWPDTFSQGPDGTMYVTASRIQDSPWFHPRGWAEKKFSLFAFRVE